MANMLKTMRFVRAFLYAQGENASGNQMTLSDANRLAALKAQFGDQVKSPRTLPQFSDDTGVYPTWEYAGIWFRCLPTKSGGTWQTKSSAHRFQFQCPECGHWISVGRVHQHIHDRMGTMLDAVHRYALQDDAKWNAMQIVHGIALKENEWRTNAVRCAECGAMVPPKALHLPGQQGPEPEIADYENGPIHRQTDVKPCLHCDEPALPDADECRAHYAEAMEKCRATEVCGACSDRNGPPMHELCEGCACMKEGTDCDPWFVNEQRDHDAYSIDAEYEMTKNHGRA